MIVGDQPTQAESGGGIQHYAKTCPCTVVRELHLLYVLPECRQGKMMSQQSTSIHKNAQSSIWQPIGAIGGAVILGIILPMVKGCQERSLLSQQQPATPIHAMNDMAPEVASTKR